jgi:hypothetical protein
MDELLRLLRSPKVSILAFLSVGVVAGFAVVLLGYQGVAAGVYAPAQTPYLVSGSLLGIAMIGTGLRLLAVHLDRVEAATEREQLASLQREALRLLAAGNLEGGEPSDRH